MKRLALCTTLLFGTAAAAQDFVLRPIDQDRFYSYEAILGTALKGAFAEGSPSDTDVLREALAGAARTGLSAEGNWKCRTMKLGDILPLVAYGNFACTISRTADGHLRLEKTSGSQRMQGTIRNTSRGLVYTGVGYVSGGPSAQYETLPPNDQTPVEPGQTHAQVGFFEQMSPGRARLLLSDPILESDLDILYLTR